jgi:hypothetical protein
MVKGFLNSQNTFILMLLKKIYIPKLEATQSLSKCHIKGFAPHSSCVGRRLELHCEFGKIKIKEVISLFLESGRFLI